MTTVWPHANRKYLSMEQRRRGSAAARPEFGFILLKGSRGTILMNNC